MRSPLGGTAGGWGAEQTRKGSEAEEREDSRNEQVMNISKASVLCRVCIHQGPLWAPRTSALMALM